MLVPFFSFILCIRPISECLSWLRFHPLFLLLSLPSLPTKGLIFLCLPDVLSRLALSFPIALNLPSGMCKSPAWNEPPSESPYVRALRISIPSVVVSAKCHFLCVYFLWIEWNRFAPLAADKEEDWPTSWPILPPVYRTEAPEVSKAYESEALVSTSASDEGEGLWP